MQSADKRHIYEENGEHCVAKACNFYVNGGGRGDYRSLPGEKAMYSRV